MRYERGRKSASRRKILAAAATLFRRDGIEGAGIASVMNAADLTHGAFYAHFPSKEALVAAALESVAAASTAAHRAGAADASGGRLARIVTRYLSRTHRDTPAAGCVLASLTSEVARLSAATRTVFTRCVRDMLALLRDHCEAREPDAAALQVLATLVGSLQLARAVNDPVLSAAFLREGKRAALRLGGLP